MSGLSIDIPTFDIEVNGELIEARTEDWIVAHYPNEAAAIMMAALRKIAVSQIRGRAEEYRGRFVPLEPGKLTEYHIKERAARDADDGDLAAQADLKLEADERGLTTAQFIALIQQRAAEFRHLSLLIASIEAGAVAGIEAAVSPQDIVTAITAAETRAQAAFDQITAQS